MLSFPSFCLRALVHYSLTQTVLSAPYLATRNITSSQVDIFSRASSLITLHPLNITHLEDGIRYHVPNTQTTLYFHLGFLCKEEGIRNTIISARIYCEEQLERKGDSPLPRSHDPFREDLGYGAAIDVFSVRPNHRLTWGILKDAMDGLWEFMVVDSRYQESEFHIYHGTLDLVGRGRITDAPVTASESKVRKRKINDSVFTELNGEPVQ